MAQITKNVKVNSPNRPKGYLSRVNLQNIASKAISLISINKSKYKYNISIENVVMEYYLELKLCKEFLKGFNEEYSSISNRIGVNYVNPNVDRTLNENTQIPWVLWE